MYIYLYKCILYRVKMLLKRQEVGYSHYLSSLYLAHWYPERQKDFCHWCSCQSFRTLLGHWLLDSDSERSKWLSHINFVLVFFPPSFFKLSGRLKASSSHADSGEWLLQKACRRILERWNLEIPGHWPEGNPHPKSRQPIRTKYFTFCSPAWTTSSAPCKPHDKVTWYARTWLVERKVEEVTWKIQKN